MSTLPARGRAPLPRSPSPHGALRALAGALLGLIVRLWGASLRIRVSGHVGHLQAGRPCVFAFWHGQQLLLAGARAQPLTTLVSWSSDGAIQVGVMRALGVSVVRGSSSRGGAQGFRRLLRAIDSGSHVAFAADGPRGPARSPKAGAAAAARRSGASLVPVAACAETVLVLRRAWDEFEVPLPFSRAVIVFGGALDAAAVCEDPGLLAEAIEGARARALEGLPRERWGRLPSRRVIAQPVRHW